MDTVNASPMSKIPFYRQRSFGEKMNASFDFLKENWKVVLKYFTYILLPLSLIQGLTLNSFMDAVIKNTANGGTGLNYEDLGFLTSYLLFMLSAIIGSWLLTALIYALIRLYNDREAGLQGITFSDIKPYLMRNIGRLFKLGLLYAAVMILVMIVLGLLVALTSFTLLLTIPAMIALFVAMCMCAPVCLFEDNGTISSFSKGIRLGFATWGGMFGILFVMGLVASVVQGVTTMPWYVSSVISAVFAYSSGEELTEIPLYTQFFNYLLAVLQAYGNYLAAILPILGLSYHYAHTAEKMESITVEDDIENFENL